MRKISVCVPYKSVPYEVSNDEILAKETVPTDWVIGRYSCNLIKRLLKILESVLFLQARMQAELLMYSSLVL